MTDDPLGNKDEPTPPDWYRPDPDPLAREWLWFFRNIGHNFTHYTVGLSGQLYIISRSRPDDDNDGFANDGGWLFAMLQQGSTRRPYVSYQSKSKRLEGYIGWRPS